MGTGVKVKGKGANVPRTIPTTGMRGGLGRTLLSGFLILTILPLTLIGWYAVQKNRESLQRQNQTNLSAVAALKGEILHQWFDDVQATLATFVALNQDGLVKGSPGWARLQEQMPDLVGVTVFNSKARLLWTTGICVDASPFQKVEISPSGDFLTLPITNQDQTFVFCLSMDAVERLIQPSLEVRDVGEVYLAYGACVWAGERVCNVPVFEWLRAHPHQSREYLSASGDLMLAVYAAAPEMPEMGILVEHPQSEALAENDRIAATFIAMILAVALTTTASSALVIRQITRPVIRLTESALAMAEGDLDQYVVVQSRDEIGILTYVFNEMASDLKSLYDDLEAKVAERTALLQQANYQIQRRVLHFQASQEVGQAITSIRDPEILLSRVVDLIRERFMYASVAMYLVEVGGGLVRMRAVSPMEGGWPTLVYAGDSSVVDRAIRRRVSLVESQQTDEDIEWYWRIFSRVVVPLRMEDRVLGALAVLSTEREGIQVDEMEVLETLAGQVAVALENARAYERERLATQKLQEAELFKGQFLSNMSHELREPLNTIIGFSRLMLKGIDGELNRQQQQDMELIYDNGQRLLFLINDMLASSQLQAGLMELKFQPVDLGELIAGVLPTASALVRGKDIQLTHDVPLTMPMVRADPQRLRQILVHLFTNAATFTQQGSIHLRAWVNEDRVYVSLSDTGSGIPEEDRERIFVPFETVSGYGRLKGAGLGLALTKEFVELHGGQIWVVSEVGVGSTFTFSLPCYPATIHEGGEGGGTKAAR